MHIMCHVAQTFMHACRVFHIVREEGGAGGGVVVQDCLELLNNLLRANEVSTLTLAALGASLSLGIWNPDTLK